MGNETNIEALISERKEELKKIDENIVEIEKIISLQRDIDDMSDKAKREGIALPSSKALSDKTAEDLERNVAYLERKKAQIIREIASLDQSNATIDGNGKITAIEEVKDLKKSIDELKTTVEKGAPIASGNKFEKFKAGDNSMILEGIYSGLSDEIDTLRSEFKKELEYITSQNISIYNELSDQLESIKQYNPTKIEKALSDLQDLDLSNLERIGDVSALTQIVPMYEDLKVQLDELKKLRNEEATSVAPAIDMDALADKVTARLERENDYSREIKELKAMFIEYAQSGAIVEFKLLDSRIQKYISTKKSQDLIDILVEARDLRIRARKNAESGNSAKGREMIDGIKKRLSSVVVTGSKALNDVSRAAAEYAVPVSVPDSKIKILSSLFFRLERDALLPKIDLLNDVIRVKKEVFGDSATVSSDKEAFVEMSQLMSTFGTVKDVDEKSSGRLKELKEKILSFTLNLVFSFKVEEVRISETDVLLDEIKALKGQLEGYRGDSSVAPTQARASSDSAAAVEAIEISEKKDIKKKRGTLIVRSGAQDKPKLNIDFSKKKSGVKLGTSGEGLSNDLVKKVAENLATTRLK